MRIYQNLIEAREEIRRDLLETGVWLRGHSYQDKNVAGDEDFDFMELSPYAWIYTDPGSDEKLEAFEHHLHLNMNWIWGELRERLFCLRVLDEELYGEHFIGVPLNLNPGVAWEERKDVWEKFLERTSIERAKFSYTYAERFDQGLQFLRIVEELGVRPYTRQAIVGVHNWMDDRFSLGGRRRIPCTMFYHFMIREEKLNLHYVMRSCDIHTHFGYDVDLAIRIQSYVAELLGRSVGTFSHFVTSLHGFRKDFDEGVF